MRKREREDEFCNVCEHYRKHEEGSPCEICGHQCTYMKPTPLKVSSSPSEILPDFLYLGGYDNASDFEIQHTHQISHILNTLPLCENRYPNYFTYHRLQDEKVLEFDNAIHFLEECEKKKTRVLVHCMLGRNRSPAIVIAYLMKSRGWRLTESYQWVKQRRQSTDIKPEFQKQLKEFEERLFGSRDGSGLCE